MPNRWRGNCTIIRRLKQTAGLAIYGSRSNGINTGLSKCYRRRWLSGQLNHVSQTHGQRSRAAFSLEDVFAWAYPEHKLTKRDLANYYLQFADRMLTHVAGRPLAIVRCPAGSDKPCFFQKHPGKGASNHLRQVNISENGAPDFHASIDDASGLISLVQMGVLEIHLGDLASDGSRTQTA
jgi:hypothetical protein